MVLERVQERKPSDLIGSGKGPFSTQKYFVTTFAEIASLQILVKCDLFLSELFSTCLKNN